MDKHVARVISSIQSRSSHIVIDDGASLGTAIAKAKRHVDALT